MNRNKDQIHNITSKDFTFIDMCDQFSLKVRIEESMGKLNDFSPYILKSEDCSEVSISQVVDEVLKIIEAHHESTRQYLERQKEELMRQV